MTNYCALCGNKTMATILDLGLQPIGNRFLPTPDAEEFRHPLVLGYCSSCNLAQLVNQVPASELVPSFDWISYNEPEAHLDELVSMIAALSGIMVDSSICGISFKDDTTLERFSRLGFKNTRRLSPAIDLGIADSRCGIETIQERLTAAASNKYISVNGRADVLIVRHILEHAHDVTSFIASLKVLADEHGYIVIEVPDCSSAFTNFDFTTLWEEHSFYFTPDSFIRLLTTSGFEIITSVCFPHPFENSLVAIIKTAEEPQHFKRPFHGDEIEQYAGSFPKIQQQTKAFLADFSRRNGSIALFGAGHLACTYLSIFNLADCVQCVIDDNPHKQGLYMPGTRLPILGSQALLDQNIKLCLLSLSPEIEDKVVSNNKAFIDNGGVFASIFPGSRRALRMTEGHSE